MTLKTVRLPLLAAFAVAFAGCSIDLQHGLTEQDANDIYVLLNENGISAKKLKEEGGNEPTYMITVSKQDASQAAKLMREYSLPRPAAPGLDAIIKTKGMIPTATEEWAMRLNALAGETTQALDKIDGVLEAKVIFQIPEKNDLTQPDKRPIPSASTFIKYRATLDGKPPIDEPQVKRFVAAAVEDLKPENVTVIMSQAQPPSADVDPSLRLQDVMGLRMTAASAGTFKAMVGLAAVLFLLITGFSAWQFARGSGTAVPKARRQA